MYDLIKVYGSYGSYVYLVSSLKILQIPQKQRRAIANATKSTPVSTQNPKLNIEKLPYFIPETFA